MSEEQQVENQADELRILQHMVDDLEVLEPKVQERIITYLYDRYASKAPW